MNFYKKIKKSCKKTSMITIYLKMYIITIQILILQQQAIRFNDVIFNKLLNEINVSEEKGMVLFDAVNSNIFIFINLQEPEILPYKNYGEKVQEKKKEPFKFLT